MSAARFERDVEACCADAAVMVGSLISMSA
jgi:hypothetical protein